MIKWTMILRMEWKCRRWRDQWCTFFVFSPFLLSSLPPFLFLSHILLHTSHCECLLCHHSNCNWQWSWFCLPVMISVPSCNYMVCIVDWSGQVKAINSFLQLPMKNMKLAIWLFWWCWCHLCLCWLRNLGNHEDSCSFIFTLTAEMVEMMMIETMMTVMMEAVMAESMAV